MKIAHIRVSEYFTFAELIFHSETISLARRAIFVEKSTYYGKCFFLALPARISPMANIFARSSLERAQFALLAKCEPNLARCAEKAFVRMAKGESREGNFAVGEYTHVLRLTSELVDLRTGYANPISRGARGWVS